MADTAFKLNSSSYVKLYILCYNNYIKSYFKFWIICVHKYISDARYFIGIPENLLIQEIF